ncbi:MAG: hypothetical protein Q7S12_03625 [bacterium]|nr:hypothetical protein [bacterium]
MYILGRTILFSVLALVIGCSSKTDSTSKATQTIELGKTVGFHAINGAGYDNSYLKLVSVKNIESIRSVLNVKLKFNDKCFAVIEGSYITALGVLDKNVLVHYEAHFSEQFRKSQTRWNGDELYEFCPTGTLFFLEKDDFINMSKIDDTLRAIKKKKVTQEEAEKVAIAEILKTAKEKKLL